MAKSKPNKTYSIFVTIDGTIGMAAGLEMCSNSSVKEADRIALRQHGYKQVGSVFTRSGRLSIDQLKEMIDKGEARTLDRVHVSTFISQKDEYAKRAAESIKYMKQALDAKENKKAQEQAELERRKTAKKLIEIYTYDYEDPEAEEEIRGTFESLSEAWEYAEKHYHYGKGSGGICSMSSEIFNRDDTQERGDMIQVYCGGYYAERICYRTVWR